MRSWQEAHMCEEQRGGVLSCLGVVVVDVFAAEILMFIMFCP